MRPGRPQEWTPERVARLGFLVGLGWDGARIAADFQTSANNTFRQASRLGLSFREATIANRDTLEGQMSGLTIKTFDDAAMSRGISRTELVRRLMLEISCDPVLIDNILDDLDERAA